MQAIILAAGMGKRLKELTQNNTKCMVKVNGITLIERLLRILDRKGLSRIVIVIGYCGNELKEHIQELNISTPISYIDNRVYNKTNNIYSLSLATDYMEQEDTLLFESDLIFEESIVDSLLNDERETLAVVDKFENWMDGTCMVLDAEDNISDFIPGKFVDFMEKEKYYKTVNIYKFSRHFSNDTYIPFLNAYRKAKGENEYYESVIKLIAMLGTDEMKAMRLNGEVWYEIDDIQDLDIAETLFANDIGDKYKKVTGRYGGYWRYPKLLDFCYLVNPFFPTGRMIMEIESNLDVLIRNYPSGMRVNNLLASRNFNVKQEHIVVGNGAAELIRFLLDIGKFGTLGIIRPTFEEYPNRYDVDKLVVYTPDKEGYRYDADDVIGFFNKKAVDTLILVNPDNPTGNYIDIDALRKIISWAKKVKKKLIIDESFVDFVDTEAERTLINEEYINTYSELYIIKSISKSFGVPGIRLGILVSSNTEMISKLKNELPIWNINSIAEFYMQIYEKYEKDYLESIDRIILCREQLMSELEDISFLKPYHSQANFIMCEVLSDLKSEEVANELLSRNILIKDISSKISGGKQYIRIAVRDRKDNIRLIENLKEIEKGKWNDGE